MPARTTATGGGGPAQTAAMPSVTHRTVTLLALIAQRVDGIGAREAERVTGIDRSGVSRVLRHLEELGWVTSDSRGTYTVGPAMFAVAATVRQRDSLWEAARPTLQHLTDTYDETTYLAVRRDERVVFREKIDCKQRIRYVVDLNEPFALPTGAAGRAILSTMSTTEIEAILARDLEAHTADSVTDPSAYRRMLDVDRDRGFSYSQSGWVAGGGGVASPFFDATGECVGAITLSAPIQRLPEDRALELGAAVLDATRALSSRLGFQGTPWGAEPATVPDGG